MVKMKGTSAKLTLLVCTLNEIKNIELMKKNFNTLNPKEIIVVDGGSSDGTYEELSNLKNIKLLSLPNKGLYAQRLHGIKNASTEILLLINADDDMTLIDVELLVENFVKEDLEGLYVPAKASTNSTLSERWWTAYFEIVASNATNTKVLGRPCLTYKKLFEGIESAENVFNEDTYLAYAQSRKFGKLRYAISKQFIPRKCPKTIRETAIQFRRYGRSDKRCTYNMIEKIDLLFHVIVRTCLYRSLLILINKGPRMGALTVYFGFNRLYGFLWL